MNRQTFLSEIKEICELDKPITENTRFKELDEWDSMAVMILTGYLNENFDLNFSAKDLVDINTFEELIEEIGVEKFEI